MTLSATRPERSYDSKRMKTYLRSSSDSQAIEDAAVVAWRRVCLLAAGFDASPAEELAHSRPIDLHALLGLAERGRPPELAARILAPLDGSAPRGPETDS